MVRPRPAMATATIMMPLLSRLDRDGDGLSTCDGDCDDFDPLVSNGDADGDGFSVCDGDCDDFDPDIYLGL